MTQQVSSSPPAPPLPHHTLTTPTLNNIYRHPHRNHDLSPPQTTPTAYAARMNGPYAHTHHSKQRARAKTAGEKDTELKESLSDNEAVPSMPRSLRRRELRGAAKLESGVHVTGNLSPTMDGTIAQKIKRLNSLKPLEGSPNAHDLKPPLAGSPNAHGLKPPLNGSPRNYSATSGPDSIAAFNHKGDYVNVARSSTANSKEESHILRSRTAVSSLRVRPYPLNHHKTTAAKSS